MNPSAAVTVGVFFGIITLIHLFYAGVVRPSAGSIIESQGAAALSSIWVIIKDYEQQLCFSLGLFCCFMMMFKTYRLKNEEPLYTHNFLSEYSNDEVIDMDKVLKDLESSSYRESGAMSTWINCIRRFKNTGNVQHASDAITASVESLAAQLEAGNNIIRYIIWAIPSIGFVGTVRGIGSALAKAEEAVSGNISGMVDMLGVAFNSTLVSLLISLVLMLLLHMLNNRQDMMIINTQKTCEDHLLTHLHK
jgi:biopolymer transport protein ExbB/TolQ